jgi:diaminopimelate decarboxylase
VNAPVGRTHPPHGFAVADGCLVVGGVPVTRLADRVGSTPFFAYDRKLITQRIEKLRKALPQVVHLNYAIKANPMPAVVQHLATLVDGFDVASALEMRTALDTTMPATRVSFAGPGKTRAEIAQAVAAGIMLSIESETELAAAAEFAAAQKTRARIEIRVNPDFELKSSGMKMGGGPKQFGIDAEKVPQILSRLDRKLLEFEGFHIFSGSQNLRADALYEAQKKTVDLAIRLTDAAPEKVRVVNIGGGFGIPYFPGEMPLDLDAVGRGLGEVLPALTKKVPDARIVVELGRYIVGEAGVYIARVIDRKESRGQVFLVTDGGLHHQLAASGNFGQVIRKNYPVAIANKLDRAAAEQANVVGCLCTPLDLLADKMELPRGEIGDLVAVFQSGAYGLTASPTMFLSHPPPAEILV